jgi:hypothetical protein
MCYEDSLARYGIGHARVRTLARRRPVRDLFRGATVENMKGGRDAPLRPDVPLRIRKARGDHAPWAPAPINDWRHMSVDRRPSSDPGHRRHTVVATRWCTLSTMPHRPARVPHPARGDVLFGEVQCLGTASIASASPARRVDFSGGVVPTFATSISSERSSAP